MATATNGTARARAWVFILYPESAPEDWQEILSQMCVPCAVSPLHDKDVTAKGEAKKPHYHVLLSFAGMKSEQQVTRMIAPLNCTKPLICNSVRGTVRYFVHLDNADKAQYSKDDIQTFGGFDMGSAFELSDTEVSAVLDQLIDFVVDNGIWEFCDLVELVRKVGNPAWSEAIKSKSTLFLAAYMRSRSYKHLRQRTEVVTDG